MAKGKRNTKQPNPINIAPLVDETGKELNNEDIKEIQFEFLLELAEHKYNTEIQREQELIQHSVQLQTAFSIMTAVIFMALPIALEHRGSLSESYFLISIGIIFSFLLVSLILASISTWRWKKTVLGNIQTIEESILKSKQWDKFLKKYNRLRSKIDVIKKDQLRREQLNNRRAKLILLSMIFFFISLGCIFASIIVAIYMIIH